MSVTTAIPQGIDFGAIASTFAPGAFRRDPFGLVSGYKAYLIFTGLDSKSDAELGQMGLTRSDLSRTAMQAADVLRAA